MNTRDKIAQEARSWIGTPYHHHGRIKGVGVDCAQLLCGVFEACGLVEPVDTGFYPVDWHLHHSEELFSKILEQHGTLLDKQTDWAVGDVFLFKFGRTFSHGSIYVDDDASGNPLFVHSYIRLGVILSGLHEEPLLGREYQHWSIGK